MSPSFLACTPGLLLAAATTAWAADAAPAPPGAVKPEEKPKWETSGGVGLSYADGNTRSILVAVNLNTQRKWEKNEIGLGVVGGYGDTGTERVGHEYVFGIVADSHIGYSHHHAGCKIAVGDNFPVYSR